MTQRFIEKDPDEDEASGVPKKVVVPMSKAGKIFLSIAGVVFLWVMCLLVVDEPLGSLIDKSASCHVTMTNGWETTTETAGVTDRSISRAAMQCGGKLTMEATKRSTFSLDRDTWNSLRVGDKYQCKVKRSLGIMFFYRYQFITGCKKGG